MNMQANPVAERLSLSDLIEEYNKRLEALPQVLKTFEAQQNFMKRSCGINDMRPLYLRGDGIPHIHTMQEHLLTSAWAEVKKGLRIDAIATAKDKQTINRLMDKPPAFTMENIREAFGDYVADPHSHVLRGLAEAFSSLNLAYKTHDPFKVGAKGLPKKVIFENITQWLDSYQSKQLEDMLNALLRYVGDPNMQRSEFEAFVKNKPTYLMYDSAAGKRIDMPVNAFLTDHFKVKRFKKGTLHLIFDDHSLKVINKALAEYYGPVLPDCPEARPTEKRTSTELAKDLSFYRTPDKVADQLVENIYMPRDHQGPLRILEPSCGDGALLSAVRRKFHDAEQFCGKLRMIGYEVDADRADACRALRFDVHQRNFLEVEPDALYDFILMNPPFYKRHWRKHVDHARKFLKPYGVMWAILPASALNDKDLFEFNQWGHCSAWTDLPVGSFKESGTGVNTGIARIYRENR